LPGAQTQVSVVFGKVSVNLHDCDRCLLGGRFRTTPTVEFGAWTAPQPCCSIAAQRAFFEFGTGFLPPETDGQKDALKTLFPRRDWK